MVLRRISILNYLPVTETETETVPPPPLVIVCVGPDVVVVSVTLTVWLPATVVVTAYELVTTIIRHFPRSSKIMAYRSLSRNRMWNRLK